MARPLLSLGDVDRGVLAAASELFEARHYPGVVAMCTDALDDEPECLPLLLIRARAQIAMRRELDAQADLRDAIRIDPSCSLAFRLLGVLAARRNEHGSAAVFFRETLRLDPGDREAQDWLLVIEATARPATGAAALPSTPVAGTRPSPVRLARGTQTPAAPGAPADALRTSAQMRPSYEVEERPTKPFARGSERDGEAWRTPVARPVVRTAATRTTQPADGTPWPDEPAPRPTITGLPPTQPPAKTAPRLVPRPASRTSRAPIPELPGFGEYLVASGILTIERLRAAQAYQRSMKVQLSTAIVTLGLATPQRIEWAAVAHQSQLARSR